MSIYEKSVSRWDPTRLQAWIRRQPLPPATSLGEQIQESKDRRLNEFWARRRQKDPGD